MLVRIIRIDIRLLLIAPNYTCPVVDSILFVRLIGVPFALHTFVEAFLGYVLHFEETSSLVSCLLLQEVVDFIFAEFMSLLKVSVLNLETRLAQHGCTFQVPFCNGDIEWVLALLCLSIELEIHGLLNK